MNLKNLEFPFIGKTGVAQKSEVKESTISSYLSDLRNRNAVSSLPPVKRLKVSFNNIYPLFYSYYSVNQLDRYPQK